MTFGGACPEDAPYRCQAFLAKRHGRQCRKYALRGERFCAFHGGRCRRRRGVVRTEHLPKFYSSVLTGTLAELVESQLDGPPHEQLQLFEELALMRSVSLDAVRLYDTAKAKGGLDAQQTAAHLMRDAINQVQSTVEVATKVFVASKGVVTVHNLSHVVRQITRIAHDVLQDHPELAHKFEDSVRRQVKIEEGAKGTTVTPDVDVLDMDATIPQE